MAKRDEVGDETNIQVVVRCRGRNEMEKKGNYNSIVECNESRKHTVDVQCVNHQTKTFTFDRVFGPTATQQDLYKDVAANTLTEVLAGYDCTIFAYGQTGTGKTYTMEGVIDAQSESWTKSPQAGIIPRALNHLFDKLDSSLKEFSVRVSFVEIYNEQLRDLLGLDDSKSLRLLNDKKGNVRVDGMEEVPVVDKQDVYNVLLRGSQKRQVASTNMNQNSSRSHTIFTVYVHIKETNDRGEELIRMGKLNMVDLAGSENIGRSGAVHVRAREAGSINKSLHALGRVITQLVDRSAHISYRDSLLTRMLQDSLGGRAKTTIIATISPASSNAEESLSTLDYAARAKNIKNRPERKATLTKKTLINEYDNEIVKLRKDLHAAREKNGVYLSQDTYNELLQNLELKNTEIAECQNDQKALEARLTEAKQAETIATDSLGSVQAINDTLAQDVQKCHRQLKLTAKQLALAQLDTDRQRYIIAKHGQTEEALHREALQLTQAVEQMTTEIALLREKSATSYETQSNNIKSATDMDSEVQSECSNILAQVDQFSDAQSKALTALQSAIDEQAKNTTTEYEAVIGLTQNIRQTLTDKLGQLVTVAKTGLYKNKEIAENMVSGSETTLIEGITEATEDMVQQLVDMIDAALAKIQTGTEVLHRDVLSISKELVDGSKRSGQQQVEMMTHLQTVLDQRLKLEKQKLLDYQLEAAAQLEKHTDTTESYYDALSNEMAAFITHKLAAAKERELEYARLSDTRTNEVISAAAEGLHKAPVLYRKQFQSAMERIQQTSLQTDQNAKDLHEITRQYTGALDEELGTALTCNKRVVSATRGAHKKVTEGMHKLRTDLNAEYTTMAEIADEHLTAYEDASAECNQMAIKDLETVAGRMDVCGTTTKAHRSTAEGMVTQLTADINAQKSSQRTDMLRASGTVTNFVKSIDKMERVSKGPIHKYPTQLTRPVTPSVLMSEFDAENKVKIAMIATMDEQHSTGTTPNRGKARLSSAIKAPNPSKRGHDETTSTPKRTPRSAKRYERENRDTLESPLIERIRSLNKVPGREDRNSLDNSENIEPSTLNFNQFASPMRKPQTPMNAAKASLRLSEGTVALPTDDFKAPTASSKRTPSRNVSI